MIGEQVGSYKITETLGKGGMGVVYVAEHTLLGKRAAIKVLRPELSRDADVVQRFFNEAKAATLIRHPCIVEVFDFGYLANGAAYLAMEMLEGESLGARLQRDRRLRAHVAVAIMRQVAGGMAAAHDKGFVHRDLKPDNIFLVPHPESPSGLLIKILDFGIAKLVGDGADSAVATRTGAILGTPLYMSPEQCRGISQIDQRSDLYSIGCILYHLLAGKPPFLGEGVGDIIGAHIHVAPPPLRDLVSVPRRLEALVMQLLAKKPDDRPDGGMAKLGRALEQILATPSLEMAAGDATTPADPGDAPDPLVITDLGVYGATASSDPGLGHAATMDTPVSRDTEPSPPPVAATLVYPSAPAPGASSTLRNSVGEQTLIAPAAPSRRLVIGGALGAVALGGGGLAWWASSRGSAAKAPTRTMDIRVLFTADRANVEKDQVALRVGRKTHLARTFQPIANAEGVVYVAFVIEQTASFLSRPEVGDEIRALVGQVRRVQGGRITIVTFAGNVLAFHEDRGRDLMDWFRRRREDAENTVEPPTALAAAITEASSWLIDRQGYRRLVVLASDQAMTGAIDRTIETERARGDLAVTGLILVPDERWDLASNHLEQITRPDQLDELDVIPREAFLAEFGIPEGPDRTAMLVVDGHESDDFELVEDEPVTAHLTW